MTEYKLMSPENLNVPITGMHSYEEEEDAMEGDVPGDNEVDEGSLIISEDPDNESTVVVLYLCVFMCIYFNMQIDRC